LPQACGNLKPHVAVGLTTGEVQVFEDAIRMSSTLPKPEVKYTGTCYDANMKQYSILFGIYNYDFCRFSLLQQQLHTQKT